MRASFFAGALTVCAIAIGCDSATVQIPDPSTPGKTVAVGKDVKTLCGLICDALQPLGVATADRQSSCKTECAIGFSTPGVAEDCYNLVACVAGSPPTLCSAGDVSPTCAASAARCLAVWDLGNGLCRGCWAANGTVTGTRTRTFRSDRSGDMVIPENLSSASVSARYPSPTGEWLSFPGKGDASGHVWIPGVPGCGYFYEIDSSGGGGAQQHEYQFTTHRSLSADVVWLGRPDAKPPTTQTTILVLNGLSGLDPIEAETSFEVFVPGCAGFQVVGQLFQGAPLQPSLRGATRVDGVVMPWPLNTGLPDATSGDRAFVTQYAITRSPGKYLAYGASKVLIAPLTMVDGATTSIGGVATQPARMGSLRLDVRLSQFLAYAGNGQLKPAAQGGTSSGALVHTVPSERFDVTYAGPSADLLWVDTSSSSADLSLPGPGQPALTYRNPFPGAPWTELVYVAANAMTVYYTGPGGVRTGTTTSTWRKFTVAFQEVSLRLRVADLDGSPIAPLISPLKHLAIDGTPAFDDQRVSATPALSWEAPDHGTPTSILLFVSRITPDKYRAPQQVAVFHLEPTATSFKFPAGIFQVGQFYLILAEVNREVQAQQGVARAASGVLTVKAP